jgi:hypothetical protein
MRAAPPPREEPVPELAAALGFGLALAVPLAERWSDGTVGADYFRQPEVEAALRDLGRLVASREVTPLRNPAC